ncbi:MAG: hypothetical protein KKB66_18520 [Alphaproteobacteria bacterium]|uniref:Uncharacterized protein n=1 Tax=viral metagenome TaxID=1070528 RepID=A0A6H1ZFJ0_9ZZZZ|nr:hypothetical protein [Alphaproteobacteria bacterium]MBU0803599.1 hypothetical protein [Alphaproteobacteria bacterium]MBU0873104.1 hypothetical protein [Alphaproteobacteria bacterium]MBU1402526.1 hypothetical protein [Alphaproteobacteria bacterium]MBU1593168.1 hypothetical protein [Alphaproteobacteria bacterium]
MTGLAWTIAELIAEKITVTVYCQADGCGYNQELDLNQLAAEFGPDARAMAADLAPKLTCWMCGSKDISLIYSPKTRTPSRE